MQSPEDLITGASKPPGEHKGRLITRRKLLALLGIGVASVTSGDTSKNHVSGLSSDVTSSPDNSVSITTPKVEQVLPPPVSLVEPTLTPLAIPQASIIATETQTPQKIEQSLIQEILIPGVEIIDPKLPGENYKWDDKGDYILAGSGDVECRLLLHATNKNYQNESSKTLRINANKGAVLSIIDNQNLPLQQLTFDQDKIIKIILPFVSVRFGLRVHRNNETESVEISHDTENLSQNDQSRTPVINIGDSIRAEPINFHVALNTREELSKEFGIATQTISELAKVVGQDYETYVSINYPEANLHPGSPPKEWSKEQIQLLGLYLTALPSHFFGPDETGKLLTITNLGAIRMDKTCATATCKEVDEEAAAIARQTGKSYSPQDFQIQVTLAPEALPIIRKIGLEAVAHESTHRIFDNQPKELTHIIENIFGETFGFTSPKYISKVVEAKKTIINSKLVLNELDLDPVFFLDTINYGLSGNMVLPDEFVSVLSQHYLHGKEVFTKMYGLVFPTQIVGELYNFTKDYIYKGIEYQQFPKL